MGGNLNGDLNEDAGGKDIYMCLYDIFETEKVADEGDCDWHYKDIASPDIGGGGCAEFCAREPDCEKFSMNSNMALGCRISKCGSDPGPDPCPADKQCPLATSHGGAMYKVLGKVSAVDNKGHDDAMKAYCDAAAAAQTSSQIDRATSGVDANLFLLVVVCSSFLWP